MLLPEKLRSIAAAPIRNVHARDDEHGVQRARIEPERLVAVLSRLQKVAILFRLACRSNLRSNRLLRSAFRNRGRHCDSTSRTCAGRALTIGVLPTDWWATVSTMACASAAVSNSVMRRRRWRRSRLGKILPELLQSINKFAEYCGTQSASPGHSEQQVGLGHSGLPCLKARAPTEYEQLCSRSCAAVAGEHRRTSASRQCLSCVARRQADAREKARPKQRA
mmetsp:Transcript_54437/g.151648  ORF Transcript_54437/g.151648 Transcript_54437/m.151648 type:complete len:222 (+) Transcript_54437:1957-2622(+)